MLVAAVFDEDKLVDIEAELEAIEEDLEELVEAHPLGAGLELLEIGSGFLPGGPPC